MVKTGQVLTVECVEWMTIDEAIAVGQRSKKKYHCWDGVTMAAPPP